MSPSLSRSLSSRAGRASRHRLFQVDRAHRKYLFTVCAYHCFLRHLEALEAGAVEESDYGQVQRIPTSLRNTDNEEEQGNNRVRLSAISRRRVSVHPGGVYGGGGSGLLAAEASPLFLVAKKWSELAIDFVVFAPNVFAGLRHALGIHHEDYLNSLAPLEGFVPYLQFGSSSSRRPLLFTHDRRFVLRLETASTVTRIRRLLSAYVSHLMTSPHSMIVKLLGIYAIKIDKRRPVYFTVMQSVFWPSSGIREKFELKGCLGGRYARPPDLIDIEKKELKDAATGILNNSVSEEVYVGLDENFLGTPIALGPMHHWFMEQLRRDLDFLRGQGLVNYSLLVGIKPLVASETGSKRITWEERSDNVELIDSTSINSWEKRNESNAFDVTKRMRRLSSGVLEDLDASEPTDIQNSAEVKRLSSDSTLALETDDERSSKPASKSNISRTVLNTGTTMTTLSKQDREGRKKTSTVRVRQVRFRVDGDRVALSGSATTPAFYFQVHAPPREVGQVEDKEKDRGIKGVQVVSRMFRSKSARVNVENKSGLHGSSATRPLTSPSQLIAVTSSTTSRTTSITTATKTRRLGTAKRLLNELMDRIDPAPDVDHLHAHFLTGQSDELNLNAFSTTNRERGENRRELPDTPNGVHIVDGSHQRYFFGLVDVFKAWDAREKSLGLLKDLLYCSSSHSSVQPDWYAARLHDFVHEHCV